MIRRYKIGIETKSSLLLFFGGVTGGLFLFWLLLTHLFPQRQSFTAIREKRQTKTPFRKHPNR